MLAHYYAKVNKFLTLISENLKCIKFLSLKTIISVSKGMIFMMFLWAFLVGGAICVVGQILIDKTKLTPARILVSFVVLGVVLESVGAYQYVVDVAGCGATVPLTGFGYTLAKGTREMIDETGWLGIFTGPLSSGAAGIGAAIVSGLIASFVSRSKPK